MDKKDKRKKILKVTGLIGLFLLVFGLSYALFTVTLNGTKKVKLKTGKLELQLLDENNIDITDSNNAGYSINLDNQVPVDDTTGLGTEAFTFKLKNTGTIDARYTIYLDDVALETGENRLPDSAVRYSLTKNGSSDNPQDLTSIGTNPNRKLDEGVIKQDVTNTYTLKVWIDEEAGNEAMDKVFAATLRVEGTQYVAPPASEYGEEIASIQLSENITATYYQPEGTGYNNNSVKRMSNIKKIDSETTYEGGTLVISGVGDFSSSAHNALFQFLADIGPDDDFEGYKYNPKELIIQEGVTNLADHAFEYIFSIEKVLFPSTLEEIGKGAFEGCSSLEHVLIPNTITYIDAGAFSGTALVEFRFGSGIETIPEDGIFNSCNNMKTIYLTSSIKQIKRHGFSDLPDNSVIYCESQEVADLFVDGYEGNYSSSKTQVIVDPTKFE